MTAVLVSPFAASLASAQTGPFDLPPGARQGEVHDPFSSRYTDLAPLRFAHHHGQGGGFSSGAATTFGPSFGWGGYGGSIVINTGPAWPGYYGPGYWNPGFAPAYPPGFYGFRPLVFPPLVLPAGAMFGPQAVWNLFGPALGGANPALAGPVLAAPAAPQARPPAQPPRQPVPLVNRAKLRESNEAVRGRALRHIQSGDASFREQKYDEAYQRYRRAAQTAPDVAEGHLRQGLALLAMARYEAAAKELKRGLDLHPNWARSAFRLGDLYGPNQAAKMAHLEALAQAAAAQPDSGDPLFLLGVMLFFDGQADRSRKFFERAEQLNVAGAEHLRGFLRELARRPAAKPAVAGLEL